MNRRCRGGQKTSRHETQEGRALRGAWAASSLAELGLSVPGRHRSSGLVPGKRQQAARSPMGASIHNLSSTIHDLKRLRHLNFRASSATKTQQVVHVEGVDHGRIGFSGRNHVDAVMGIRLFRFRFTRRMVVETAAKASQSSGRPGLPRPEHAASRRCRTRTAPAHLASLRGRGMSLSSS